jgi:hypothetical protein
MPNLPGIQAATAGAIRDCLRQPYPSPDVWNIPIGASAIYSAANLAAATGSDLHLSHIAVLMDPTQPSTPVNQQATPVSGQTNCQAASPIVTLGHEPVNPQLSIPGGSTNNYGVTFVHADGHTVDEAEAFASCVAANGYVTMKNFNHYTNASSDLNLLSASTVNGPATGSTGAAQTPISAGVIRIGELVPGGVIPHALQIILPNAACYLTTVQQNSFRWPATKSDAYWATGYGGSNPLLTMGVRLALRPADGIPGRMRSPMGQILATAFQNYGSICANTGPNSNIVCTEVSGLGVGSYTPASPTDPTQGGTGDLEKEFSTVWNGAYPGVQLAIAGTGATSDWAVDVRLIFANLWVVGSTAGTNLQRQTDDYNSYQTAVNNYATGVSSNYTGFGGGAPLVSFSPDLGTVGTVTVPAAPVVTTIGKVNAVEVDWTTPNNGGATIDNYEVYQALSSTGPWTFVSFDAASPLIVNETAPTVPNAPTGITATAATASAVIAWNAPASDGGASITDYTVQWRTTAGPGAWNTFAHAASIGLTQTVTGLSNGTGYDFQVAAVNSVGTGAYDSFASATPVASPTVPGAPTGIAAVGGATSATVTWVAPASNGGAAITDYTVQSRTTAGPGAWSSFAHTASTALSQTVTSLTNGTSYDFQVAAVNSVGTGAFDSFATATPVGTTTKPQQPVITSAVAGVLSATITWTVNDGGSAVTSSTVTITGGAGGTQTLSGAGLSLKITGLTAGTSYTFTVACTNINGTSVASAASPAVVPTRAIAGPPNILFIPLENKPFLVPGSSFPQLTAILTGTPGYAWWTQFYDVLSGTQSPSGPNYCAITFGNASLVSDDSFHNLSAASFYDRLGGLGITWKAYAEAVTTANLCSEGTTNYCQRHFPVSYCTPYNGNALGGAFYGPDAHGSLVRNAGSLGTAFGVNGSVSNFTGTSAFATMITDMNSGSPASFYFAGPCLANQGHSDPGAVGGAWAASASGATTDVDWFLAHLIGLVKATTWYANHGNIILWWDEGNHSGTGTPNSGEHTNFALINEGPARGHGAVTGQLDHLGLLADLLNVYGAAALGGSHTEAGSILSFLDH